MRLRQGVANALLNLCSSDSTSHGWITGLCHDTLPIGLLEFPNQLFLPTVLIVVIR